VTISVHIAECWSSIEIPTGTRMHRKSMTRILSGHSRKEPPMSSTYDEIVQRLSDALGIEKSLITPDITFVELKIDSLALVEFSVILDEEYDVPPLQLTPDSTVGEAVALVEAAMSSRTEASS
jgi:acyl carrier protein